MNTIFDKTNFTKKPSNTDGAVAGTVVLDNSANFRAESISLDLQLERLNSSIEKLDDLEFQVDLASEYSSKGLNPDAVNFFVSTADRIRKQLNVPVPVTMSMEDFAGTTTDNCEALQTSLSGVKDVIVNGWNAVITFLKEMYEKIAVFITKLFDNMPNLKKEAEKLKDKASEITGSAENKTHKFSKISTIGDSSKGVTLTDYTTNLKGLFGVKGLEALVNLGKNDDLDKLDADSNTVKALTVTSIGLKNDEFAKLLEGMSDTSNAEVLKIADNTKYDIKATGSLPGCKAFAIAVPKQDSTKAADGTAGDEALSIALTRLGTVKYGFRNLREKVEWDKDKEIKTLESKDMEAICEVVIEGCDHFEKSKSGIEAGRKSLKKLTTLAEKLKGNATKTDYADVKKTLNASKGAIMKAANLAANPQRDLATYFYSVGKAGLSYVETSMKEYKD